MIGERKNLLGNDRVIVAFARVDRFFPPAGAQAPFTTGFEPDAAKIIATRGREVEEFAREDACIPGCGLTNDFLELNGKMGQRE